MWNLQIRIRSGAPCELPAVHGQSVKTCALEPPLLWWPNLLPELHFSLIGNEIVLLVLLPSEQLSSPSEAEGAGLV